MKLFFIQSEGFDSEWGLVRAESKEQAEDLFGSRREVEPIDLNGCFELSVDGKPGVLWSRSQDGPDSR